MYVRTFVCILVPLYVCRYIWVYVRTFVCVYVPLYVCTYLPMYVAVATGTPNCERDFTVENLNEHLKHFSFFIHLGFLFDALYVKFY